MITKTDAILIGTAIVAAANREKDNHHQEQGVRFVCNGVQHYALSNLWYDVFTAKTKEYFGYDFEVFFQACERKAVVVSESSTNGVGAFE